MAMILSRETRRSRVSATRTRHYPSFQDFVLAHTDDLSRRIATAAGFVFEPESRAGYAAQLGLPSDDADLRDLWEAYNDGEDLEYELLRLDNNTEIFVCVYRHYVTALICPQGRDAHWGTHPPLAAAWGASSLCVQPTDAQRRLLLENRRLAQLMLADIEMDDPYLCDGSMTTYHFEVWAPSALRRLAIAAAVDLDSGVDPRGVSLSRLNAKMRAQVEEGTAIYRWYDADRRPIYYGIAGDLAARTDQHAHASRWSVFAAYCEVTRASTRRLALDEERRLILRDLPVFNRQHNDTPEARDRCTAYLAAKGRLDLAK